MTRTLAEPLRLERLDAFRRRIPATGAMRTDGLVFASDAQMRDLENDEALKQVANVACLPGIVGPSIAHGGMIALTREPSGRRASTIGHFRSIRRPSGRMIRSITFST